MTIKQVVDKYILRKAIFKVDKNVVLFEVKKEKINDVCKKLYKDQKLPLKTMFATDDRKIDKSFKIYYVFAIPKEDYFVVPFITIKDKLEFESLTPIIHELAWYEREVYSFFGLKPVGYPAKLQRLILHPNWPSNIYPLRKDFKWNERPKDAKGEEYEFQIIKGEGIYEIPVGPIHAGIIEPGHFRFSVAGEEIVNLEPQLGFVHKGTEKLFENLPLLDKIKLSERVSGDSAYSHSLAFCQALEILSDTEISKKAKYLRVIFSELERLANHFNDLGFIMNDTAFTFGGSQGTRLREVVMQIINSLTGSRYFRGVNTIGGVTVDISKDEANELKKQLEELKKDYTEVLEISRDSTSMMNRLKGSGVLDKQVAIDHGVVGIAARALGLKKDARIDHPYAAYPELKFKMALQENGDVLARFNVRAEEVYTSIAILNEAIDKLPTGHIVNKTKSLKKNAIAIGITEGWRGDIVYVVMTDNKGEITRVVVRDPSYLNWPAVPYAVAGNPVPEFPLINKSFNLSYSGTDK